MSSVGFRRVFLDQLPHYIGKIRWLFADAYRYFPGRIRGVVALDALGVLAGGLWLAGLLIYVDSLESPERLAQRWPQAPDLAALPMPLVVSGFMGLGLLSAVCLYLAQWRVARICVDYQKITARRILKIVSDPTYFGWQTIFPDPPRRLILRFTGVSLQLTSLSLRRVLRLALPLVTLVAAVGALVIASPWLSLLLIPIACVYLAPLYVANRRAARAHIDSVALTPKVRGRLAGLLQRLLSQSGRRQEIRSQADRLIEGADFDRSLELVFRKRLADSMVSLINTVFTIACLIALFAFVLSSGEARWSDLLLYLIALRFAIGGLGGVTSVLIGLSRFLPEYERLSHFLDAADALRQRRASQQLGSEVSDQSKLRVTASDGSSRKVNLRPGALIWVMAPAPVGAVDQERILLLLERRLKPKVDLAPGGKANVVLLRPEQLDAKTIDSAQGALHVVFDGFPKRLARQQMRKIREALTAVLVYDGSDMVAGGDARWYVENLDEVVKRVSVNDGDASLGDDVLDELA